MELNNNNIGWNWKGIELVNVNEEQGISDGGGVYVPNDNNLRYHSYNPSLIDDSIPIVSPWGIL